MEGFDPKGLDIYFRRQAFEMILSKLNDLAKKSNYLSSHGSLNDLARKFEEKMYEKATNKQDYLFKIRNKLEEVARVYLPATFSAGNQQGNTMISSSVVQPYPTQQKFDGNCLLQQNPNLFSSQYQTNSKQLQQNQQFGQQNYQLGQQNPLLGQQNPLLGQQNLQFGQQNPQLGQQNLQFGQQDQHFIGQQNQQFGLQSGQQNVVQRDARYPLDQQNSIMNIERYKQSLESFNQAGNGQIHQTNYQASTSQRSSPLVNLHGQINQFHTSTSQHSSPFANLQGQINQFRDSTSQHSSPLANLQGQINQFQASTSQHSSPLANLQGQINQFQASTSRHSSPRANNLQGQINQFQASTSRHSSPRANNLQGQTNQFQASNSQYSSPRANNLQGQINQFQASNSQYSSSLANLQGQINQFQASTSQHSSPLANNLQGQINRYQDSRLHGSEMPSACFQSQNYVGDNLISQSHMPALSSFTDETTNADQCQLLIVQFRRARSSYLPELNKWLKMFQTQLFQAQTVNQLDGPKKHIIIIQQMIRLLNLPENELLLQGTDKLRQHLNSIISYYNQMVKKLTTSAVNQFSSVQRPAWTNGAQNFQTAPSLLNRPMISSSTIAPGFSYPLGSADHNTNTLLNMRTDPQMIHSPRTTQSLDVLQSKNLQEMENHLLNSTSNQATSSTSKVPEKRKEPMDDSTTKQSTNAIIPASKKPCLEPKGQPSKNSHESWLDLANLRSKNRSIPTRLHKSSEPNRQSCPSTPITPSSVPKENGDLAELFGLESFDRNNGDFQDSVEASKSQGEANLDQGPLLGIPESSFSPLILDCNGLETIQPQSSDRPFDRKNGDCQDYIETSKSQGEPNLDQGHLLGMPEPSFSPLFSDFNGLETIQPQYSDRPFDRNNGDCQDYIEASKSQGEPNLDQGPLLGIPELSFPPVVSDCSGLETTQSQSSNRPIDRLLNAVSAISKEALIGGVDDMRSAITEMDRLPEIAYLDESEASADDDLTIFLEDQHYYCTDNEEPPNKKRKCEIESVSRDVSMPWDGHDSTQWSKLKPSQDLLDEIKETNHKLFETSIQEVDTDPNTESNGTIIRCTYSPIAMSSETLRMFACDSINISVELLVPFDYPISSPKILDCRLPARFSGITIEMTEKAKSIFDSQVRCIDPLTVREMAQVWDLCARSVTQSYAKFLGAESFSSKYGGWERVVQ